MKRFYEFFLTHVFVSHRITGSVSTVFCAYKFVAVCNGLQVYIVTEASHCNWSLLTGSRLLVICDIFSVIEPWIVPVGSSEFGLLSLSLSLSLASFGLVGSFVMAFSVKTRAVQLGLGSRCKCPARCSFRVRMTSPSVVCPPVTRSPGTITSTMRPTMDQRLFSN